MRIFGIKVVLFVIFIFLHISKNEGKPNTVHYSLKILFVQSITYKNNKIQFFFISLFLIFFFICNRGFIRYFLSLQ